MVYCKMPYDAYFKCLHFDTSRSGSVVGTATAYGLDGRGSNPGGSEIFRTCPDRL